MLLLFTMLGASFALVMTLMIALWVLYFFQQNARLIDIGWGAGFIITAWIFFFLGNADFLKQFTIAIMATIWAGRLTGHLYRRYQKSSYADPRYQQAIQRWRGNSPNVFIFLLLILQGVLIIILSLPFLLVAMGSNDFWSGWEAWGIVLWLIGVLGETVADLQLSKFYAEPANRVKVCRKGLWRFSRHPNYFFDSLVWIGFALFAIPSAWGWLALISPFIMIVLFLRVTGIPLTEAESVRSKGELYQEYQRTTSPFIPWFPNE
jgi:steroid 5-alpha reductase family enzyme